MLLMKVVGEVVRGVSMMYATTVGRELAMASVMIAPDADHVKISICPGVSTRTYLNASRESAYEVRKQERITHSTVSARFSTNDRTWSNFVVKRFNAVKIPPLGPRLYLESL